MPQSLSIDNFLDNHPDNHKINIVGKLAISQCILEAERSTLLFSNVTSPIKLASIYASTWISTFAERLTEGLRKSELQKAFENVSFINFNYDRCLETALFSIIQNSYFTIDNETAAIVSGARIFHPYGSLGRLPWELQSNAHQPIPYGANASDQTLLTVAKGIKTFTEQIDDGEMLRQVRYLYGSASKIIFLGFGFHDINMKVMSEKTRTLTMLTEQYMACLLMRKFLYSESSPNHFKYIIIVI